MRRVRLFALVLATFVSISALPARAFAACVGATRTWTGAGADNNWSTAANWGGTAPSCASDALVFPAGAARLTNNNDFASGKILGSLSVSGDGYTFTGNSLTLTGGITVTAPTVGPGFSLIIQTGAVASSIVNNGAPTTFTTLGGIIVNGPLSFSGTGDLFIDSGIAGASPFTKDGPARLHLTNTNNAFTGGVTINAGAVRVKSQFGLGTPSTPVAITNTGVLEVEGAILVQNPLTFSSTAQPALDHFGAATSVTSDIVLAADTTIRDSTANTYTLSGTISGTGKLHTLGNTISITGTNTYTGGTIVDIGAGGLAILQLFSDSALGPGPITIKAGAAVTLIGDRTMANGFSISGKGPASKGAIYTLGTGSLSGAITLQADSTFSVDSPGTLTLGGVVGGAGGLAKNGTGTLVLGNGLDAYAGTTHVVAGTLANPAGNQAIPDASAVTVDTGATLSLASSETVGSLAGAGAVGLGSAATTLTCGGDNSSPVFSGVISGAGKVVFTGTGVKTLTGNNTFSGGATATAGNLSLLGGMLGNLVVQNAIFETANGAQVGTVSTTASTVRSGSIPGQRLDASGSLTLDAASAFVVWLDDKSSGDFSQLAVTGGVALGGASLDVTQVGVVAPGDTLVLVQNDGVDAVSGTFQGLPEGAIVVAGGARFQLSYQGGDGNDVELTVLGPADMATPLDLALPADLALAQVDAAAAPDDLGAPSDPDLAATGIDAADAVGGPGGTGGTAGGCALGQGGGATEAGSLFLLTSLLIAVLLLRRRAC